MATDNTIKDSTWNTFTQGLTTIRSANSSFNTELTATIQKLDTLNKTKAVLRVETSQAQNDLREAENQYLATGNAADRMKAQITSTNYDDLTNNLSYITDKTKSVEKGMNDMVSAASKADNRVGSMSASGLIKGLAKSELGQMAISTGLNVATTGVSSALGSNAGNIFNNTMSDAITGAMAGFTIGGPIGAAVGGLAGGAIGYVNGKAEEYKAEDEVYKAKVNSYFDNRKKEQNDDLTKGQTLSTEQEDDRFEIKNLVGNDYTANSIMSDITHISSKSPIEHNQAVAAAKTILHYDKNANVKSMLTNLADTGAGLNMNGDGINQLAADLGNLSKKSVVSESDFSSFIASNIDVWKYLKAKYNVSNQEQLAKIGLTGKNAVSAILEGTKRDYAGKMDEKAKTITGKKIILNNLTDASSEEKGEGFNQIESSNLDNKIKFQRDHAFEYELANKKIGIAYGSLQQTNDSNFQQQMNNIFRGKTFENQDYVNAVNSKNPRSGFMIDDLFALGKTKADNATESSDINHAKEASSLNLYAKIQLDVNQKDSNWDYNWQMQQEGSKGRASVSTPFSTFGAGGFKSIFSLTNHSPEKEKGSATGIFRVPYNNFPALLHEGETVSTAVEARSARNTPSVTITGNNFVVREEADIDKIARAFVEKLTKVSAVAVAS